jgi:hypothetical protein
MASPRLLTLLVVSAAACGDDRSTSASASDSGTGGVTTTGDTTIGTTTGAVPTTGDSGSHSASDSETGTPTGTTTSDGSTTGASASGTTTGDVTATTTDGPGTTTTTTTTGDTTTGECVDVCDDGAVQCVGDEALQTCAVGDSGCLEWGEPDPCPAQQVCQAGECAPGCADECDAGAEQCADGGVSTCVDDPISGCTAWSDPVDCDPGKVCEAGACVTPVVACTDNCVFTKQNVAATVDFYDVWGSDAKAVWVVGASGTALYHNGITWKSVDSGVGKRLECVHGSAADDVYAIANDGAIIRWNGAEWLPHVDLNPIWESSACLSVIGPGDLLALVYDENGEKQVLYRVTDGVKSQLAVYTPQAVFTPDGSKLRTISIHAFSATQALITADRALRWDGNAISNMNAPNPSFGLWALAPDFAYAAASHSGIGHRWDGVAWKIVNPGLDGYLHQFTGTTKTRVFGVGETPQGVAAIVAFDGIGWTQATTPGDAKALFAGWSAATGEVFAVGKNGTILIGK